MSQKENNNNENNKINVNNKKTNYRRITIFKK